MSEVLNIAWEAIDAANETESANDSESPDHEAGLEVDTPDPRLSCDQGVMTLVALYEGVPSQPTRQRPLLARNGPSEVFR